MKFLILVAIVVGVILSIPAQSAEPDKIIEELRKEQMKKEDMQKRLRSSSRKEQEHLKQEIKVSEKKIEALSKKTK